MRLDEKLIHLRKEKGLTQLELAEAVKVSRQAVSKWESGGGKPSTENLRGLSDLYGVPVDYLLNEEEKIEGAASPSKSLGDSPEVHCKDTRKMAIKLGTFALIFLILIVSIGIVVTNKNKENLHLGEVRGEAVVSNRNFSVGW